MRKFGILGAALIAGLFVAGQVSAENRTFIVPNNADGYGVDRCLANGERCGHTVATNYCQSQQFALAKSFGRVEKDEITGGAMPASSKSPCTGGSCDSFVAIICSR